MCLAIPVKIKKIQANRGILEDGRKVDISLVNSPQTGDWLLCHANLAIGKVDEKEAREILKLSRACQHQRSHIK